MGFVDRITKNNLTFTKEEWLLELKIKTIIWMVFVSSSILLLFSILRLISGDFVTASVDFFGALLFILINRKLKNDKAFYNFASITLILLTALVVTSSVFVSGHEMIRASWFFALLCLAYYLRDGKEGLKWLVVFIAILVSSYIFNPNPNNIEYVLLIGTLILISSVLYFYDKIKDVEKQHLSEQKQFLEEQVAIRTKELNELNATLQEKVKDEVSKNRLKDKFIIQQNKMAMMGEMIGNIAHQFRQPLNAIRTTTGGLKIDIELEMFDENEAKDKLDSIDRFVMHLSNTIEDFRNFFKEDKEKVGFYLSESIEKDLFIIESTIVSNNIAIIKNFDPSIKVKLLKNELTQGVLNILNNAKDALVEFLEKERLLFIDIKLEDEVPAIIIKDNAGGIPEEILPKIFDDKFTTKGDKDGTGIGLFMTKQMIEGHIGGEIIVSNEEFEYNGHQYKGAQFKIKLPKVEA